MTDNKKALDAQATQCRLLVLGPGQNERLLEHLSHACRVGNAATIENALDLLARHEYDAVLADPTAWPASPNAGVEQQAIAILNTIAEGVCIIGPDGAICWANHRISQMTERVRRYVADRARDAFQCFADLDRPDTPGRLGDDLSRKFSFTDDNERYFEMIARPMRDARGRLSRVATIVWEATAGRKLQQRIDAIDRAGRELARLDAEMLTGKTVEQRIALVQEKIIRYAKDLLLFDHFVVRVLNRRTNRLEVLFGVGVPEDQIEIFANAEGNGISGYVAATGRSYICYRTATDPHYIPGIENAKSSLTVPLRLHDRVIGILNVESHHEGNFTEDDRQVAEIFGRYIAIALNILDLLVVERYHTTGQTAETFYSQICEPLNQIMNEVSLLQEDYIGHDDLRHRLRAVIDHTDFIKKCLKDIKAGPKGIVNVRSAGPIESQGELSGKQILVVDDEDFIRQTIAAVLQKYGCAADTAADGREAMALIGQRSYDLVLSDIKLPHFDGYQIFAAAQEKKSAVILMTGFGYDPGHSIVRANRQGLSAVLYKPFKTDQLLGAIRKALRTTAN